MATFQTAVIERYRRRETSVERAIVEMYLAGVSPQEDRERLRAPLGGGRAEGKSGGLEEDGAEDG